MKQKKQNTKIRTFRIGWRSEADYSRRMMGCRFGWVVCRGGCDQGGAAHNRSEKPASRFARCRIFVRSLSAPSELVRSFRAQKSPKHLLEAFRIGWRSEADYSRRMMGCRCGWVVCRGGCDQGGGCSQPIRKASFSLRSLLLFCALTFRIKRACAFVSRTKKPQAFA